MWDVWIGKACIINIGAIVEHGCTLDDAYHISPRGYSYGRK